MIGDYATAAELVQAFRKVGYTKVHGKRILIKDDGMRAVHYDCFKGRWTWFYC